MPAFIECNLFGKNIVNGHQKKQNLGEANKQKC